MEIRQLRGLALKLTLAVGSVIVTLVILEAAARLGGYVPEDNAINPRFSWQEQGELWLMPPRASGLTRHGRHPIRVNNFGLRGEAIAPKRPGTHRIVFVGDSVTFGFGVPEEATFASVVEDLAASRQLPVETVNAAVAGWSSRQYLLFLDKHGTNLQPDVVVVGVVLNDITELASGVRQATTPAGLTAGNTISWLAERSAAIAALKSLWIAVADPIGRELRSVEELVHDPDSSAVRHAMKLHLGELEDIVRLAAIGRYRLALVLFPFRFQLTGDDLDAPQRHMREFARTFEIPVLDTLPLLGRYPPERVLIDHDHLTVFGHRVVAEAIVTWLGEQGLLDEAGSPSAAVGQLR